MADAAGKIHTTGSPAPRAMVLATQQAGQSEADVAASCAEMQRLADTLGIEVVAVETQKRSRNSANFVGSGKLAELVERIGAHQEAIDGVAPPEPLVDLLLVDAELTPRQLRLLERAVGVEVLDRTAVILEIFEKRAGTREAALEVELARLRYELPRRRDVSAGNDRQGGGGRGARGNTNLAIGKGRIRDRIAELQAELGTVQARANTRRERRAEVFQVALVGYTNAGKSSVMHGLTASDVFVEDQLFATLGTTVRQVQPPARPAILLSDTVGFIRDLPHELIASFRSTLDEALDADHLLVVVDSSDPEWRAQLAVTRETLDAIGAWAVAQTLVLNKVDCLDEDDREALAAEFPHAILMSAKDPDDVRALRDALVATQELGLCEETLLVPFARSQLLGEIHERARVVEEDHTPEGTILRLRARAANLDRWRSKLAPTPMLESADDVLKYAARLGFHLIAEDDQIDESGLDFRVVRCVDKDDHPWIVRTPRRPDVFTSSRVEGRALRLLREKLPVQIPDWKLHTPEIIAYPLLPGVPAWTMTPAGELTWNVFEPDAVPEAFVDSMARFCVALQAVPVSQALAARLPVQSVDECREGYRAMMLATRGALAPSDAVWARWNTWLDEATCWPDHVAMVHGDLHPGHLLVDEEAKLVGVLDWTEAKVADPARDFAFWYGCFSDEGLTAVLEKFEEFGGRTWPGMREHIVELWSYFAVEMASWALEHGNDAVLENARALLPAE